MLKEERKPCRNAFGCSYFERHRGHHSHWTAPKRPVDCVCARDADSQCNGNQCDRCTDAHASHATPIVHA